MLSVVCCLLSAVCCLLFIVCCLLSGVCCLLCAVCCLLSVVCCLFSVVWCLLSAVCCMWFVVCYLWYVVWRHAFFIIKMCYAILCSHVCFHVWSLREETFFVFSHFHLDCFPVLCCTGLQAQAPHTAPKWTFFMNM